jgi:hypothetical protein
MAKKIEKVGVKRERGYLYYIDKSGNVCKAPMAKGGKKGKPETVAKVGIKRVKGYLYFIDKQGDVCAASMNRKGGKRKKPSEKIKPTIKYVVYEQHGSEGKLMRAKKIKIAGNVRDIKVTAPTMEKGLYGTRLRYESKVGAYYEGSGKFVTLAKPAKNVRVVNKIPAKYS